MNRKAIERAAGVSLLFVVAALVMVACSPAGGSDGDPFPERTQLNPAGASTPAHEGSALLDQVDYFVLNGSSVSGEIMIVELDQDLRLELTSRSGLVVTAVSTSAGSFGASDVEMAAATASTQEIDPASIPIDRPECRGSCIVLPAAAGTYYFQVSGALLPTDYSVYVYGDDYADTYEPSNDGEGGAEPYVLGASVTGAIETIGDVDWWEVGSPDQDGVLTEFFGPLGSELDLQLYVFDAAGSVGPPLSPGETIMLFPGDMLRVESGNDRAARAVDGYYYLSPVPEPTGQTDGSAVR